MSNKKSIFDRNLKVTRPEINLSTFNYLISEVIQYYISNQRGLEKELEKLGENIGPRLLELILFREKSYKHEIKHLEMLKFIHTPVFKFLFGKSADSLERVKDSEEEYLIKDLNPIYLKYVSEDKQKNYTVASFMAGIIKGILCSAGFEAKVSCQTLTKEKDDKTTVSLYPQTVFVIEFAKSVIKRENNM